MITDFVQQILTDLRFQGQPITWDVNPEEYTAIRHAWLTHVADEESQLEPYDETVWRKQIATILSVFSENSVMEIVPTSECWEGHTGAKAFYEVFILSFAGMQWVPQALVIGPQGVLQVVNLSGTLVKPFAGLLAVGQPLQTQWVIYFPWSPDEAKFWGETNYSIRFLTAAEKG